MAERQHASPAGPEPMLHRVVRTGVIATCLALPWSLVATGYLGALLSLVGWGWFLTTGRDQSGRAEAQARRWALIWALLGLAYAFGHLLQLEDPAEIRRLEAPSRLLALSGMVFVPLMLRLSWRDLFWPLALAGAAFGAIALLHPPAPGPDVRVYGYYTYENMMGFAPMSLALLLAAAQPLRGRWTSVLFWVGLAGCLAAVVRSGTRGAWPGLLPLVWVLWRSTHPRDDNPRAGHGAIGRRLALILAIGLTLWLALPVLHERLAAAQADLERIDRGVLEGSLGMRLKMAQDALEMIRNHPWRGHGLAAFHQHIVDWADRVGYPAQAIERGFQNPHNQYLHWAVALGLPAALACTLALLALPAWIGWKSRGPARTALLALSASVPLFLMTEAILDRHHGAQWFCVVYGLATGIALVAWTPEAKTEAPTQS